MNKPSIAASSARVDRLALIRQVAGGGQPATYTKPNEPRHESSRPPLDHRPLEARYPKRRP